MPQQASPMMSMLPILLIFIIFYFLLIRPQQKKQQEHQEMVKRLKKNDEVITNGGIHGTVVNVKDNTVVLRVDDNCKIEIQRNSKRKQIFFKDCKLILQRSILFIIRNLINLHAKILGNLFREPTKPFFFQNACNCLFS